MRIYENGVYRDATQDEITEIKYQNQQMELDNGLHDMVTADDLMKMILSGFEVTTPDGNKVTADQLVDTVVDLPFKAGFKWTKVYDATNSSFAYVMVEDPNGVGSENNPIILLGDDEPTISGAYYEKDEVRYVNMDGQLIEW